MCPKCSATVCSLIESAAPHLALETLALGNYEGPLGRETRDGVERDTDAAGRGLGSHSDDEVRSVDVT